MIVLLSAERAGKTDVFAQYFTGYEMHGGLLLDFDKGENLDHRRPI